VVAVSQRESRLIGEFEVGLDEVSALALGRRSNGGGEVLNVGDEAFVVERSLLDGVDLRPVQRRPLTGLVPPEFADASGGSEWEALAVDGVGQVFVVREASATVFVFSPELDELRHVLELDLSDANGWGAELLREPQPGPEGVLLLKLGHLLVVKQREPILLIEFGPAAPALGLGTAAHLGDEEAFELPADERSTLVALRSWSLRPEDELDVESANDLALDRGGRLHAISSKSRRIYELRADDANGRRVSIGDRWKLPDELEASKKRKAEGLAFDDDDRVLVAIDAKDKKGNVFLLEPLERDR
jgi:hypothetical protein